MQQDEQLVDRIVAGVLARLGQSAASVPPAPDQSAIVEPAIATWNENIITAEVVNEKLKGTSCNGLLHVGQKTILTPSALDELRSRGIVWKRVSERHASAAKIPSQTWKMILQHVTPQVKTVLDEIRTNGRVDWTQEIAGTLEESITMAVTPLSRAEVTGVMMLTDRPHAAACLANRHEALRAGVIKEFADVDVLKKEFEPNMFCLAPDGWGGFALRKVVMACINPLPAREGGRAAAG